MRIRVEEACKIAPLICMLLLLFSVQSHGHMANAMWLKHDAFERTIHAQCLLCDVGHLSEEEKYDSQ